MIVSCDLHVTYTCPTRVGHAYDITKYIEVTLSMTVSELSFFGYILFVGSYRWCLPIIVSPTFSMPPLLHLQLMKVLQPIVIIFSFSYDEIRVKWGQLYERFRGDVFYNARE